MDIVLKYFPRLEADKIEKLNALYAHYEDWNSKINVLSRKDFENFYTHHVLHSLSILKYTTFKRGTKIMDIGTGGGFPSVPLAIMLPEVEIVAVDSIQKKIKVIEELKLIMTLPNLSTKWGRAEEVKDQYDFIVSRAVAPLSDLLRWSKGKIHPISFNELSNGLITLKGGDLKEELREAGRKTNIKSLADYFEEEFFETKKITYTKVS